MAILKKLGEITALTLLLVIAYGLVWIAASKGVLGDVEFGYYGEYYAAIHRIEESGYAESIKTVRLNPDLGLEEFELLVTLKSGAAVTFDFDAKEMDVEQVCYEPEGIIVHLPQCEYGQRYTLEQLSQLVKDESIQVRDLKDILRHMSELKPLFEANSANPRPVSQDYPNWRKALIFRFDEE